MHPIQSHNHLGRSLLLSLFALALPLAGQAPVPATKSIPELRAFYQRNCLRCHGEDGAARGADGKKLGGVDFTKIADEFRKRGGSDSEREIRAMTRTIRKGIFFGLSMPAWKDQLSEAEAELMVREVLLQAAPGKVIKP